MNIPNDVRRLLNTTTPNSVYESKLREFAGKDITFVVVGAMDGVTHDRLYPFASTNSNWSGLLVEPIKGYFEKVKANYNNRENLKFENVAISDTPGKSKIYMVDPAKIASGELPDWTGGISSLDPNGGCIGKDNVAEHVISEDIVCETFDVVAKRNDIESIDVLQVDAEGYDAIVVKQVLNCGYRPKIIFFEVNHLSDEDKFEMWTELKEMGYVVYPSTDWTCIKK